ncbi:hypothetical protein ABLG96_04815 [Nakamurella sp. A5-74]|uniref:Lipoprotein n=1 Tax=Nakamurella sp. A5-74 TaxID=3158264 RepID=A0AAU8DTE7_9ACTN
MTTPEEAEVLWRRSAEEPWRVSTLRTLEAMGPRATTRPLAAAALTICLAIFVAGCSSGGADTAAGTATQQLADALTTPDAEVLRVLVEDDTSSPRTDLLVAEVVAANALAGKRVEITADLSRTDGSGTFTITSPEVPGLRLPVTNRLTEIRAPGALRAVDIRADRDLSELLVNGHRVRVDPVVPAGKQVAFRVPPGEWSLGLPQHPFLRSAPKTVQALDFPEPEGVLLSSIINADGEAEAKRQADAVVAACERPTVDPKSGCGGALELCVGARTTRTVTFSAPPEWTVDHTAIAAQSTLRRTVTTVCTDRSSGAVVDRMSASGTAKFDGDVTFTADGLTVELG